MIRVCHGTVSSNNNMVTLEDRRPALRADLGLGTSPATLEDLTLTLEDLTLTAAASDLELTT